MIAELPSLIFIYLYPPPEDGGLRQWRIKTKRRMMTSAFYYKHKASQYHRRNPAEDDQRNIIMHESRDNRVFDVVVLSIDVKTHGRTQC